MRYQPLLIISFLLFFFSAKSQKVIFLDSCENIVDSGRYSIRRTLVRNDLVYEFEDRYPDRKMVTWGKSRDSNGMSKLDHCVWYHNDGHIMAVSTYDKYGRNPKWVFYGADEKQITSEDALKEIPLLSFRLGKTDYKGRCLFYAKHGKWIEVDVESKDTVVAFYEVGKLVKKTASSKKGSR